MPSTAFPLVPHILAAVSYILLAFHFWRTRWHESDQPVAAPMLAWERGLLGGVLGVHGIGLYIGLFGNIGEMRFSFALALSLMLWLAVLIYWLESFHSRMEGLQPMVLPLAACCAALPILFSQVRIITHAGAWGFKLHFFAAMLAYSLFTLSALHAIFMAYTERKLHQRVFTKGLASLPPLLTMENLLFRMIFVAFLFLTGTLASGVLYSEEIYNKAFSFDHKTLFAFASWGIFAVLLVGRHARGWRGRTALRWTMTGFMMLLLAYVGSRFVAEAILGRT
ncbi:MAG: cytochrome c biogenesis protein CcsA [Betaproteobacteria bacterium]|nr:cytochrome c biogenesis protein CcsA [Betaproteobacteria bacterium]